MNILTRFDMAIGGLMEKIFTLRRGCQPMDLARLLRRAVMAHERKTLKAVYAPNRYDIYLPIADMERIEPIKSEILKDLNMLLEKFMADQRLLVVGSTSIGIDASCDLEPNQVLIRAQFVPEACDASVGQVH